MKRAQQDVQMYTISKKSLGPTVYVLQTVSGKCCRSRSAVVQSRAFCSALALRTVHIIAHAANQYWAADFGWSSILIWSSGNAIICHLRRDFTFSLSDQTNQNRILACKAHSWPPPLLRFSNSNPQKQTLKPPFETALDRIGHLQKSPKVLALHTQ